MLTQIEGLAGILVQILAFSLTALAIYDRGRSRALFFGGVVAVFGYSLVLLLTMLIGIPWGITNFALLFALALIALQPRSRRRLATNFSQFAHSLRGNIPAIAIVVFLLAFHTFIAAMKPDMSVDGQLYHGPVLVQMIQTGTIWGWSVPSEYLYYSDLTMVSGINLATFTGLAMFDDGIQIQHLLVLVLGINWALTTRFRSSFVRASFALLIVTAPVIWLQPRVLYVDLGYGAAVASAIFLIALSKYASRVDVWVAGAAIGAVLATKPAGVLTSGLLTICLIVVMLWRSRLIGPIRKTVFLAIPAVAVPLVAGFGFYLRNQFSFNSATFPVTTDIGPFRFPGILELSLVSGDPTGKTFDLLHIKTYLSGIWQGITGGLVKMDYDPRAGGFGYIPLIVTGFALALCVIQLVVWLYRRRKRAISLELWKLQLLIVGLSLAVISIQPATSNSRYVIGPTAALLTAILLTTLSISLRKTEALIAVFAIAASAAQIAWTEKKMYPGLKEILTLRTLPAPYQPTSPGNPWGRGELISWLPDDANNCVRIAIETSGGVTSGGLNETTRFATFPYGLYGPRLCNSVETLALKNYVDEAGAPIANYTSSPLNSSNYLVLHSDHVEAWKTRFGGSEDCLVPVANLPGDSAYPQSEVVLRNLCVTG